MGGPPAVIIVGKDGYIFTRRNSKVVGVLTNSPRQHNASAIVGSGKIGNDDLPKVECTFRINPPKTVAD